MKFREGSLVLYVLIFFVFFISWFDLRLRLNMQDQRRSRQQDLIRLRLRIEAAIVDQYRNHGVDSFDFEVENIVVVSYREDNLVYVIVSGDIRMRFKYDIIEDGSFIHSHWED